MATKVIPGWIATLINVTFGWLRTIIVKIDDAFAQQMLHSVIDFGSGVIADLSDDDPENRKQIELRFRKWVEEGPVISLTKAKLEELIKAKIDEERWQKTMLFITPRSLDFIQLLLDTDRDNRPQINAFIRREFSGEEFFAFLELWLSAFSKEPDKAVELVNFVKMAVKSPEMLATAIEAADGDRVILKEVTKEADGSKTIRKREADGDVTVIKVNPEGKRRVTKRPAKKTAKK